MSWRCVKQRSPTPLEQTLGLANRPCPFDLTAGEAPREEIGYRGPIEVRGIALRREPIQAFPVYIHGSVAQP